MDGFGGGAKGYWKNRYYSRLDDANENQEGLSSGGRYAKPPSGKHRRKPPSSSRRPKVVKLASQPQQPPSHLSSSTSASSSTSSSVTATSNNSTTRLTHHRRRRFFRIRLTPRLAFLRRVASFPARLLRRIQRGYVSMMLKFAGAMGGAAPEMAGYSLPRPALKEYDDKVLVEIYRALVAQGHVLVVPSSGAAGSDGGAVSAVRLVAQ